MPCTARRAKGKKPKELTYKDILTIVVIENKDEVKYEGISWTITDMCHFWEPLLALVELKCGNDDVASSQVTNINCDSH